MLKKFIKTDTMIEESIH